jgi:hypothetical protein
VPALVCLVGIAAALFRLRATLPLVLLAAVGALLGGRYVRNSHEAVLLSAPLFALAMESLASAAERRALGVLSMVLPLAVGILLPAIHLRLAPNALNTDFGVGSDGRLVPKETLSLLATLPPGRVIHDCSLGGYLIWRRVPVYCDGRAIALYTESDIERLYLPLFAGGEALEAVSDRYDIRYGLARPDSDFERALTRSPEWIPLAYDRESSLFVRRRAMARSAIEPVRYLNDPAWLRAYYAPVISDDARRAALSEAIGRALAISSASPTLRALLVYLGREFPRYAEVLQDQLDPR